MHVNNKILSGLVLITLSIGIRAETWEPVSAESLVELPANLIEKRIKQDFRMSPMANELIELEGEIADKSLQIKAIQGLLENAELNEMIDERVDLVQLKSGFLDLMQSGQSLRQQQLENKIEVYQQVLQKLYSQGSQDINDETYQLKLSQQAARARMEKVMQQVDDTILNQDHNKQSPYAKEFADNLSKIEQLKSAISAHQANLSGRVDGVEVSTQEYLRQLLMQSSSEQSLLDQEALMLSYMSKLVALDAQALEFSISEAQEQALADSQVITTPANSVALFL